MLIGVEGRVKIIVPISVSFPALDLKLRHAGASNPICREHGVVKIRYVQRGAYFCTNVSRHDNGASEEFQRSADRAPVFLNNANGAVVRCVSKKNDRLLPSVDDTAAKSIIRPLARFEGLAIPLKAKFINCIACNGHARVVSIFTTQSICSAATL